MLMKFSAMFGLVLTVMVTSMGAPEQACAQQSGVPLPVLTKAFKGDVCVAPLDDIRRNHMNYLTHQRDETLREGIRGKKFSLKGCIECHATVDPNVKNGTVRTVQPFCAGCHEYAAVTMDCFACHNPELPLPQSSRNEKPDLQQMILSHLSLTGKPKNKEPPQ